MPVSTNSSPAPGRSGKATGRSGQQTAPKRSGKQRAPGRSGSQTAPGQSGVLQKTGRFQAGQPIAENEFSRLTPAVDTARNRSVLIRRFKPKVFEDPQAWSRFQEQLQSMTRVQVGGLLAVEAVSGSGAKVSLLIPGTNGDTLRTKFRQTDSSQPLLEDLLSVAETLDRLHRTGPVHGDVRPETIFYSETGEPRLGEIVSHYALCGWTAESQTLHPQMIGRLFPADYVAPETREGGTLSARSDQYALALVYLEALLHVRPGGGEPLAMLTASQVAADKQPLLENIKPALQRALALDPAQRFPTCRDFALNVSGLLQKSQAGSREKLLAFGVPALLVVLMFGLWLFVSSQRANAVTNERKQKMIDELAAPFQGEIDELATAPVPESLTGLDPTKSDKVDVYVNRQIGRNDQEKQQEQEAARKAFLEDGKMRFSLMSTAAMRPTCAFWHDGNNQVLATATDGTVNFSVTVTTASALQETVQVTAAVFDQKGNALTSPLKEKFSPGTTSHTFSGKLRPNLAAGKWAIGTELSVQVEYQFEGEPAQPWTSASSAQSVYAVGGVETTTADVKLSPAELLANNNGYAQQSSVQLEKGEQIAMKVNGTVRLATPAVYEIFTGSKVRKDIAAKGIKVEKSAKRYRILSRNPDGWGALLYRVGDSGKWTRPVLTATGNPNEFIATLSAGSAGQLYFSIDSVDVEEGPAGTAGLQPVKSPDRFWGDTDNSDSGHFDVTLIRRQFFPDTLPSGIRQKVEAALQ